MKRINKHLQIIRLDINAHDYSNVNYIIIFRVQLPRAIDQVDQGSIQFRVDLFILGRCEDRLVIILQTTADAEHIPSQQGPFLNEILYKIRIQMDFIYLLLNFSNPSRYFVDQLT